MNYLPIAFTLTSVEWLVLIIIIIVAYIFLNKYNKKYVAQQEEKDRQDTAARLSKRKAASALANLKRIDISQ